VSSQIYPTPSDSYEWEEVVSTTTDMSDNHPMEPPPLAPAEEPYPRLSMPFPNNLRYQPKVSSPLKEVRELEEDGGDETLTVEDTPALDICSPPATLSSSPVPPTSPFIKCSMSDIYAESDNDDFEDVASLEDEQKTEPASKKEETGRTSTNGWDTQNNEAWKTPSTPAWEDPLQRYISNRSSKDGIEEAYQVQRALAKDKKGTDVYQGSNATDVGIFVYLLTLLPFFQQNETIGFSSIPLSTVMSWTYLPMEALDTKKERLLRFSNWTSVWSCLTPHRVTSGNTAHLFTTLKPTFAATFDFVKEFPSPSPFSFPSILCITPMMDSLNIDTCWSKSS
jgi:hypothetical protein